MIPPILAAGDYVLGVAIRSPYQRFLDTEVLTFRLWPPPDRAARVDRPKPDRPAEVRWQVERPGQPPGSRR